MSDVTVIIPTFNMQEGAINAIESVLRQKVDAEIIVIDDCSSPKLTLPTNLIQENNIKLIRHSENRGAAAARNTGVSVAKSQWVSFLDSDDFLTDNTLADRISLAKKHHATTSKRPTLYGCAWMQSTTADDWIIRTPLETTVSEDFATGCWYCPGSCIVTLRQNFLDCPFDESLRRLEDFDFGIRFGLSGGELVVHDIVGAVVQRANNPNAEQVELASGLIKKKFRLLISGSPKAWRLLCAYLDLEISAISYRNRRVSKSAYHLAKSLFLKPRLNFHFSPGWKIVKIDQFFFGWKTHQSFRLCTT